MLLSNFSSYFELLAGINLGYAIFDYFRDQLSSGIFSIDKDASSKLDNLKSRLQIQISERSNNPEFSKLLKKINEKVAVSGEILEEKEKNERVFIEALKPISYLSAFFCLYTLLIAGFTWNNESNLNNFFVNERLLYTIYYFGIFNAIFSFSIFAGTFSSRILEYKQVVSLPQTILSIVIFLISSYLIVVFFQDGKGYYLKVLLLFFLPILLYALFSFLNIIRVDSYCKKNMSTNLLNSIKLCMSNFKYSLIFLLILVVFFVPVCLNLAHQATCNYSFYLVVLTVPVLLYFFMPLRVYFHKKRFRKEYLELSQRQSEKLEDIISSIED